MQNMQETPQSIVAEAMRDREVYRRMVAREAEVWGKILPARQKSNAAAVDARASAELKVNRNLSSLAQRSRILGRTFEYGLSLGCGAGRFERELVSGGTCKALHGVDISAAAIEEARRAAAELGLNISYEVADLNFVELQREAYDLVVAQTSLHHVLFLERVAYQAWQALKPDGYMWIHDFIGETQGQYEPNRLKVINDLLALLPEKFRKNHITGRIIEQVKTPKPGGLGSPFEKIRSGEIVPVFLTLFDVEWKCETTAFLDLVAPFGTRAAYVENEDTRTIFELLMYMEDLCLREGIIKPVAGQYLLRPKPLSRALRFEEIFPQAAALERGEVTFR